MTVHRLRELVQHDFEAVNTLISDKIQAQSGLIDDLASHIIQSGGKRLRPLMVLLASRACGYVGEDHITLAAMVEFFHTATLLHDDVIDESTLRRGRETANTIWGDKVSILVGDYLFTEYMQMMVDIGDLNIMQMLTTNAHQITCGELKQLDNRHKPGLTESDYFDVIRAKTSLLFAASACLGSMISPVDKTVQQALYDYGMYVGNAFQLIDDALDYCADAKTIGKNIGDDLAHGVPTLPILYALKHGTEDQQAQIRQTLTEGSREFLPDILQAIKDTKAIEYTQQVASIEVDRAISALNDVPDSEYKTALIELAKYALLRDH